MPLDVVEGWTGVLDFTLRVAGTVENLTDDTVTLILTDKDGNTVQTTGDMSVLVAANGTIRYTPDVTDLLASGSPYKARFKVDSGTDVRFFPNGPADEWRVHKP